MHVFASAPQCRAIYSPSPGSCVPSQLASVIVLAGLAMFRAAIASFTDIPAVKVRVMFPADHALSATMVIAVVIPTKCQE